MRNHYLQTEEQAQIVLDNLKHDRITVAQAREITEPFQS